MPGWVKERLGVEDDGEGQKKLWEKRIQAPTFHVQGSQDEWLWAGNGLIEKCYESGKGKSERVDLEIGHHYPVAVEDNERIAEWMIGVLREVEAKREVAR